MHSKSGFVIICTRVRVHISFLLMKEVAESPSEVGANIVVGMAAWLCFSLPVKIFSEAWHLAITLGFQNHLLFGL